MKHTSRRDFIKAACAFIMAGIVSRFGLLSFAHAKDSPLPAGKVAVPATDPVAKAIGYVADIKSLDKSAKRGSKDFCNNCALYTAVDAHWGRCQMLTSGLVTAQGWCRSYSKKV